jgi:hypothetical protein
MFTILMGAAARAEACVYRETCTRGRESGCLMDDVWLRGFWRVIADADFTVRDRKMIITKI